MSECVPVLSVSSRPQVWSIKYTFFQCIKHLTQNSFTLLDRFFLILLAHLLIFIIHFPLKQMNETENELKFVLYVYILFNFSFLCQQVHYHELVLVDLAIVIKGHGDENFNCFLLCYFVDVGQLFWAHRKLSHAEHLCHVELQGLLHCTDVLDLSQRHHCVLQTRNIPAADRLYINLSEITQSCQGKWFWNNTQNVRKGFGAVVCVWKTSLVSYLLLVEQISLTAPLESR